MALIDRIANWFLDLFSSPTPVAAPLPKTFASWCEPFDRWPAQQSDWATKLLELHNEARAARLGSPLSFNPRLSLSAQLYAEWCAANNILPADHHGPNGDNIGDRAKAQGYNFSRLGENIAAGQTTVEIVFNAWMSDVGHYQNIVNRFYQHFGAGRAVSASGKVYWCCDFGAALNSVDGPAPLMLVWTPVGLDTDAPVLE